MNKIVYIIASVLAIASVACSKQETTTEFVENHDPAHRTFIVDVQQTKTTLDGLAVKWASTDEIRILGYTEGEEVGNAVFKLKSGAGSTSAVFEIKEGETLAEYDEYYAVYPAVAIKTSELNSMIKLNANLGTTPSPIENGFDPNYALMTASYDGSKLVFRHAMAYIKIQIAQDDITKFQMAWTGGSASCTKPGFIASNGNFTSSDGGYKSFTSEGTFKKGSYYYFPIVARGGAPGTITLTYYKGEAVASTSTTSLSSKPWVQGEVYDLGAPAPVFTPTIIASNVNIEKDATSGNIAFTVSEPTLDGNISIATTDGKTNPADFVLNTTLQTDHFEFTCDENGDTDPRKFYVTLTYTYNSGSDQVTKDVVITQAGAAIHKVWDFSSGEWTTELAAKGESGSDITSWVSTVDGLTWTSTAKSKWNSTTIGGTPYTYIQAGGKGSESDRVFTYSAPIAGTLKVTVSNTGGSADETRMCTVKVGSSDPVSKAGGCPSTELRELTYTVSSAATVKIYPTGNALRFYKITFDSE